MAAREVLKFLADVCTGREAIENIAELEHHAGKCLESLGVTEHPFAAWVFRSRTRLKRASKDLQQAKRDASRRTAYSTSHWLKNYVEWQFRVKLVVQDPADGASQRSSRSADRSQSATGSAASVSLDDAHTASPRDSRSGSMWTSCRAKPTRQQKQR